MSRTVEEKTRPKKDKVRKDEKQTETKEKKKEKTHPKAKPLCPSDVTKKVYELIGLAKKNGSLKIGVNETIKKLNKGDADLVLLGGNALPFAIVEPLVVLCENKNRTFLFLPSVSAMGKACGLPRPVAACTVVYSEDSSIRKLINEIREQMINI
ncbi:U4/U6 small nuclear ribonucleoprotein SNU13 [Nematocida minor]|uniref:U4/U6 small nuclear ribonucleoprotein SNU13 n=1 Tax=Nematocida minor TaxID=1912983 RepID=UPI00222027E6|nr:U4/U6 small nuclear ribonucleoprotein SNU13 [Nematocida minor]KAI5189148.1 U4/U6 small nuclear ribonucleoprotein SNU13 [Nematocida minor]